ncbi:MAG TPA: NlpC/P60 family protein, partial [Phnomibacter sp.]|nr:NlpC/P60 family protein [Phnomibacter sp.]
MLKKSLGGLLVLLMAAGSVSAQKKTTPKKALVKKPATKTVVAKKPITKKPVIKLADVLPAEAVSATLEKDLRTSKFDSLIWLSQAAMQQQEQQGAGKQAFDLRKTLGAALETFMPFQFKYAILLNESVEKVTNVVLYKTIDDWYGTRYRYGGTTSKGIDCSAFMQVLSNYAFGWMLPRTAREQYYAMEPIKKDELKEGDFVFFNTRGGISHVGMYLQNHKFVHSSSSDGVCIGDLNSKYWSAR